jgi:Uma2 family endonuclease
MLTAEKKKYTIEDYMMLEEGAPFQLINNDLVMSPAPIPEHQIISGRLFNAISYFLAQTNNNGIAIYSPVDVYFDEGNIIQSDLIYIAENRKGIIQKRIEDAPDMVIEILSPSNAYYNLRQKKDIYQKYGVPEYIIVDPIALSLELHTLKDESYQLHQKAEKTEQLHSVVLPGLSFDLAKIFA